MSIPACTHSIGLYICQQRHSKFSIIISHVLLYYIYTHTQYTHTCTCTGVCVHRVLFPHNATKLSELTYQSQLLHQIPSFCTSGWEH